MAKRNILLKGNEQGIKQVLNKGYFRSLIKI